MSHAAFAGLDLLGTAVIVLDTELRVVHANPAAEHAFMFGIDYARLVEKG